MGERRTEQVRAKQWPPSRQASQIYIYHDGRDTHAFLVWENSGSDCSGSILRGGQHPMHKMMNRKRSDVDAHPRKDLPWMELRELATPEEGTKLGTVRATLQTERWSTKLEP